MKASPHPRQAERLDELLDLGILDTPREGDFDDVVNLASRLCNAPISVINLIDADRQWFKAEVGLGVRETPLDTSLCSHAILESEFVEIPDTLLDRRMKDNPLCLGDTGLRFYAGALLRTRNGLPVGTLCVLDTAPRSLTDLQRDALIVLARQVMAQMELRRALRQANILRDEGDHRIKNSLQSVASLINIQARNTPDEPVRFALKQVSRQISSVAVLHAILNSPGAAQDIDLIPYLRRIAAILTPTIDARIGIHVSGDEATVSPEQAAAIGTIMNEFASNSAKHAFPSGQNGHVAFSVTRVDDRDITFTCSDDGIGFDPEAPPSTASLGMRVMKATAESLGGPLVRYPSSTGVTFSITFRAAPTA